MTSKVNIEYAGLKKALKHTDYTNNIYKIMYCIAYIMYTYNK